MSRRNFHAFAWIVAAPLCALVALTAAGVWTGCDDDDQSEEGLDKDFLRDAAAMQAMGLPVYWLGTEFTVDGLVFRGPDVADFGDEVEGGLGMKYLATLPDGGGVPLGLTVRSKDAWELAKDRVMNPPLPGMTRRAVTVGDREGVLLFLPLDTTPLNTLWLVLDLGDVVVVAQALAGGPVYPGGRDYNPFINNPDLLVQVMQDLRPYPE